MMATIWKAVLRHADVQAVEMPEGAEILCAREQHEQICIWFRCDPHRRQVKRVIGVFGTGNLAPDGGCYIGTASLQGGSLIFHVFEQTNLVSL
jgi:hypothetical protein